MPIPTVARSHIVEHLQKLGDLPVGKALFYCVVRPDGEKDPNVRVALGDSDAETRLDVFTRLYKQDEAVKASKREDWVVARGAFVGSTDGVRTLPGVRGNRVTSKAQLKDTLKALRTSFKEEGIATAPLQKAIDGKFGTMGEYTEWARKAGVPDDGEVDETEMSASKDTKSNRVVLLVDTFKKLGLKAALAKHAHATDDKMRAPARLELERLAKELEKLVEDSVEAKATLEGRVLGKTRYKDSLATLDDLRVRLRQAQHEVQVALGLTFEGTDLAGRSDAKSADPILKTLRGLADQVRAATDTKKVKLLADMYFAADYWLKAAGVGQAGRKFSDEIDLTMKPQVEDFYTRAANRLAKEAGVGINALPAWLEKHYGKGMEKHGTELDVGRGLAKWMTEDQRDLFRVHIKGGKLYQYDWWTWGEDEVLMGLGDMKLVPADSAKYPSEQITKGFTGFVLSMGGDLYVTHQHAVAQHDGDQMSVFHSSYMAGLPIRMAGELKIVAGAVKVVNARSGHYRPSPALVVNFLKHMQMLGVKVESVMPDPQKNDTLSVDEFLQRFGDKEPDADAYEKNDKAMSAYRQGLQFAAMVKEDEKAFRDADVLVAEVERANRDALYNRTLIAQGETRPYTLQQDKRLALEATRAAVAAEEAVSKLKPRIEALQDKLAERQKNHDALVKKDATPVVEGTDGYVKTLSDMLKKLQGLIDRTKAAALEARNPTPVVIPKPSVPEDAGSEEEEEEVDPRIEALRVHEAYHGDMDSNGAAQILKDSPEGSWLLRNSVNKGNAVAVSHVGQKDGKRMIWHATIPGHLSYDEVEKHFLRKPTRMVRP